ncbi:MAG: extracellular solute-binding protein [Armatimonadota bacterium]
MMPTRATPGGWREGLRQWGRRWSRALASAVVAAAALLVAAHGAAQEQRTELVVWGVFNTEGWRRAFAEFERRHPEIELIASTTGGRMDEQKLMCGIAGDAPPDVINQDRFSIGGWAARGAFMALDDFIARDQELGLPDAINPEDFYSACWMEASYEGKAYAIPNNTDDRVLYYNEDLLRKAGYVDAEGDVVPPRTWAELREYALRLTERDEEGRITRIGFIPNYGNSWLYLYGWQNGGRFMSDDGRTCTLNDPRIVEALTYVTEVYDSLGGVKETDAFAASFQAGELDPFLTDKVALVINGNWNLDAIGRHRPDMNFGVAPAPVPEGHPYVTWSGGFSWAIPVGARQPELAWEFIRWCSSLECGLLLSQAEYKYARSRGRIYVPWMSANRRVNEAVFRKYAPRQERLRKAFRQCLDLLSESKFRPVTPVGQLLWDEHVRAMDLATHHAEHVSPREAAQAALDQGAAKVQEQLDLIYGAKTYPPLDTRKAAAVVGLMVLALIGVFLFFVVRSVRQSRGLVARGETGAGYAFASPWLAGFLIFTAGPIIVSIVLSFTRYDVLHPAEYVAADNYKSVVHDPLFWKSLGNTAFMLIGVPLGMVVGLGIAMLLNAKTKGLAWYRTIYYLPAIVPTVASSILWIWVLNPEHGLINAGLRGLDGLLHSALPLSEQTGVPQPNWLTDPSWAKPSIILMGLWAAGQGMIIWLAGLKGIPEQYYEAAAIDGAGTIRQFVHITLPMLSPYIFFSLIMGTIGTFQIFNQAYIMTQGGPVDATLFYVYYLFNCGFRYFKMGYASALAWVLFVIILALTLIQLKLAPRWVHYEQEAR